MPLPIRDAYGNLVGTMEASMTFIMALESGQTFTLGAEIDRRNPRGERVIAATVMPEKVYPSA
jgi:hypothetical protein